MPHNGIRWDLTVQPIAGIWDLGMERIGEWNGKPWNSLFWQTKVILLTLRQVRESKPGLGLSGIFLIRKRVIGGWYTAGKELFSDRNITGFSRAYGWKFDGIDLKFSGRESKIDLFEAFNGFRLPISRILGCTLSGLLDPFFKRTIYWWLKPVLTVLIAGKISLTDPIGRQISSQTTQNPRKIEKTLFWQELFFEGLENTIFLHQKGKISQCLGT